MKTQNLVTIDNIYLKDQASTGNAVGRTICNNRTGIRIEIYVLAMKKEIDQIVQYALRCSDPSIIDILKATYFKLYPEYVLTHELMHVWQFQSMGSDQFRRIRKFESCTEPKCAYRSYEVFADNITKSILSYWHGNVGEIISDFAITIHRSGYDDSTIQNLLSKLTSISK